MSTKVLVFLATIIGGALAATSTAAASISSSSASPTSFLLPSAAAQSFAAGTTTVSVWLPATEGSIVGVNNCETTIIASNVEQTYTYTQGLSDFQYNFNTFSDGFSFIETSSCSFISSSIASFSVVALCKETYVGSSDGAAVTNAASTTLYPDQFQQFPLTVSGGISQLASASGACTPTATPTSSPASTSGSVAGSAVGSVAGSTAGSSQASASSSTRNAAPTQNARMAAGFGAAALAGLAML